MSKAFLSAAVRVEVHQHLLKGHILSEPQGSSGIACFVCISMPARFFKFVLQLYDFCF